MSAETETFVMPCTLDISTSTVAEILSKVVSVTGQEANYSAQTDLNGAMLQSYLEYVDDGAGDNVQVNTDGASDFDSAWNSSITGDHSFDSADDETDFTTANQDLTLGQLLVCWLGYNCFKLNSDTISDDTLRSATIRGSRVMFDNEDAIISDVQDQTHGTNLRTVLGTAEDDPIADLLADMKSKVGQRFLNQKQGENDAEHEGALAFPFVNGDVLDLVITIKGHSTENTDCFRTQIVDGTDNSADGAPSNPVSSAVDLSVADSAPDGLASNGEMNCLTAGAGDAIDVQPLQIKVSFTIAGVSSGSYDGTQANAVQEA